MIELILDVDSNLDDEIICDRDFNKIKKSIDESKNMLNIYVEHVGFEKERGTPESAAFIN